MVWSRDEDGRRARSEESDDESLGKGREGEHRWKDVYRRDMQTVGLRAGEEGDGAYWRAKINNRTGDPR